MAKRTQEKISADETSDINFIGALDELVENVLLRKGAKKYSLLLLIRSYYKKDDDLYKTASIPADDLIKELYFPGKKADTVSPQQINNKRKSFSSLKSSLNQNLRTMFEKGTNLLGIIIGKSNVFNVSQAVELKRAGDSIEKGLSSELSDILSKAGVELKGDMVERLKEVIHNEFVSPQNGIEKIKEKGSAEKASEQLQEKLKEMRNERSSLKKEIEELKESVSVKEMEVKDFTRKQEVDQKIINESDEKMRASIQTDVKKQMKALTVKNKGITEDVAAKEAPGGATKKASEMPSSGEGSVGDFGDEMELAAPPLFEKLLTQDYSLSITVPPGEFFMGCDDLPGAGPRHEVIIEKPFRISKYPITIIQFLQFVKETGYFTSTEKRQVCGVTVGGGDQVKRDHNSKVVEFIVRGPVTIDNEHASWKQPFGLENIFEQKFNHPVTMITWWDCMAYCDWLSQKAGAKCRLPTEKEWEYVASNRGQLKPGEFYWGHEERVEKHCNSQNTFVGDTTPVDKFLKNKTTDGVRDMLGNVWEWTLDAYCSYSESPDGDDDKQEYKVVRGGSYALDKEKINTFIRRPYKKMYASSCIGFRVISEE